MWRTCSGGDWTMCCTGRIRLNCPFHLVVMVCLIVVAIVVCGYLLIDAAGLSVTALAGLHLHGGFPLPVATSLITLSMLVLPIAIRSINLNGWTEPPATPPPLLWP